jgi:thymidylate synthase (FAD)
MPLTFKTLDELKIRLVAYTETAMDDFYEREVADMLPVKAARVSHGNEDNVGQDPERDVKLMRYLAAHKHFSPFEHQSATFLIEAPLFVAREWMRHRTQAFNEISMRYTSDPADTFWIPDDFRTQATKNKQSSAGVFDDQELAKTIYKNGCTFAYSQYTQLLTLGIAREQARAVLPVGMVTRFFATANLRNWAHWYALRSDEGAQQEIRHYATKVDTILTNMWPNAWGVLKETGA